MAGSLTLKTDLSEIEALFDDIADGAQKAVRPGAQAASQVIYEAVRLAVPVSEGGHWFHGSSFRKTGQKYWFDAGTLRNAIYQVYSTDNSSELRATYHISWNYKKAPYGFMVEYGTSRAPAHPFIGRTANNEAVIAAAQDAAEAKLMEFVNGI